MTSTMSFSGAVFHGLPHLDFDLVNTTVLFTPDDPIYQQALLLPAVITAILAALLLLLYTLYFIGAICYFACHCHGTLQPKPGMGRLLWAFIAVLSLLLCASVGIGLRGNDMVYQGSQSMSQTLRVIGKLWDFYAYKVARLADTSNETASILTTLLDDLRPVGGDAVSKLTEVGLATTLLKSCVLKLQSALQMPAMSVSSTADSLDNYEQVRWWIMLSLGMVVVFFILVCVYGALKQRRPVLVVITILGLLILVSSVGLCGGTISLGMGVSDFCNDSRGSIKQYANSTESQVLVDYFIDCNSPDALAVFLDSYKLMEVLSKSVNIVASVRSLLPPMVPNITKDQVDLLAQKLQLSTDSLSEAVRAIDCHPIHNNFHLTSSILCFRTIDGAGMLFLFCAIVSFAIQLVLVTITPLWTYLAPLRSILKRTVPTSGVIIATPTFVGPPGE